MDKEDVVHVYNGPLLSPKKKKKGNEIVPFAETWMDLETVIQSEISQKEKTRRRRIWLVCGIQKNGTDELINKMETDFENL